MGFTGKTPCDRCVNFCRTLVRGHLQCVYHRILTWSRLAVVQTSAVAVFRLTDCIVKELAACACRLLTAYRTSLLGGFFESTAETFVRLLLHIEARVGPIDSWEPLAVVLRECDWAKPYLSELQARASAQGLRICLMETKQVSVCRVPVTWRWLGVTPVVHVEVQTPQMIHYFDALNLVAKPVGGRVAEVQFSFPSHLLKEPQVSPLFYRF